MRADCVVLCTMRHYWLISGGGGGAVLRPRCSPRSALSAPLLCPAQQQQSPTSLVLLHCRAVHSAGGPLCEKDRHRPSSMVEESVTSLRERIREKTPQPPTTTTTTLSSSSSSPSAAPLPPVPASNDVASGRTLWQRFMDELRHYYHGSKLLVINVNVSRRLVGRLLRGDSLTRREHRQLVRTVGDLFRVVPFSVFVIIPFMELLLPVFIKLFPNMLPSTFQTANAQEAKIKQKLKIKLETAKFLQKTLDSMALKGKGHYSESAKDFAEFFKKIRSSGEQASNEQILRYSKFFEDELTLDSLPRPQLTALCRVLEVQTFGTDNFLRFLIQMKLRRLAADDMVIHREGIESLTVPELQHAVRARGMRSYGVSELRLRSQLTQWIDLSLNEKVPPSLLLLSRALYLPDNLPAEDQLKATISLLPESLGTSTRAAIGDREGKVDFKTRVDLVKEEERRIKEEREELELQRAGAATVVGESDESKPVETADIAVDLSSASAAVSSSSASVDVSSTTTTTTATTVQATAELTSRDLSDIEDAIEHIATDQHRALLEKEKIDDIKEELADYKEDLDELQSVVDSAGRVVGGGSEQLHETKAARRLFKGVNKLIGSMDAMIEKLHDKQSRIIAENIDQQQQQPGIDGATDTLPASNRSEEVAIAEVIQSLHNIQGLPDQTKLNVVADVLSKMDYNHDGCIRIEDVYEVIAAISEDNVNLTSTQMKEIIELLDREKVLELERRIEKALSKETDLPSSTQLDSSPLSRQPISQELTPSTSSEEQSRPSTSSTDSSSRRSVIHREGIESLTVPELQHAVRARGMRSYGVSELRLRSQLTQWIDLSLNEKVPPSLLLLSRALYLPDNLPAEDQLKATISLLPESLGTSTRAAIGDREGKVDFKTRVDLVKEEERRIKEEREELELQRAGAATVVGESDESKSAETADIAVDLSSASAAAVSSSSASVDVSSTTSTTTATTVQATAELTSRDLSDIEDAIEHIATDQHRALLEKEKIDDIKEELADYKEDLDELQSVVDSAGLVVGGGSEQLHETKAARRLFKGVNKLIGSMDAMIEKLHDKQSRIIAENIDQQQQQPGIDGASDALPASNRSEEVAIAEVIQSLHNIQGLPDQTKLNVVADVLSKMDYNHDGCIRIEDVYEVIAAISEDNVNLTSTQMKEIIELLDREKVLELERRIEKALSKETDLPSSAQLDSSPLSRQPISQDHDQDPTPSTSSEEQSSPSTSSEEQSRPSTSSTESSSRRSVSIKAAGNKQ